MISKEFQNDLYTVTSITRLEYVQTETPLSLTHMGMARPQTANTHWPSRV